MKKKMNVEIKEISYSNLFKVFLVVLVVVYFLLNVTKSANQSSMMIASMFLSVVTTIQGAMILYRACLELLNDLQHLLDLNIAVPYFRIEKITYSIDYRSAILKKIKSIALLSVIRI
jgi:hypothetical protein